MTNTDIENQNSANIYSVRRDAKVKLMLLDLEEQITGTIRNISGGIGDLQAPTIVRALSDLELLTLDLWAGGQDTVISKERDYRLARYEEFTRRYAKP